MNSQSSETHPTICQQIDADFCFPVAPSEVTCDEAPHVIAVGGAATIGFEPRRVCHGHLVYRHSRGKLRPPVIVRIAEARCRKVPEPRQEWAALPVFAIGAVQPLVAACLDHLGDTSCQQFLIRGWAELVSVDLHLGLEPAEDVSILAREHPVKDLMSANC